MRNQDWNLAKQLSWKRTFQPEILKAIYQNWNFQFLFLCRVWMIIGRKVPHLILYESYEDKCWNSEVEIACVYCLHIEINAETTKHSFRIDPKHNKPQTALL